MLEHIDKVNLEAFEKKYPFKDTIHISKESFQKMLQKKDLHYVWLPACPRANRITSVFRKYHLEEWMTEHRLSPYYQLEKGWIFPKEDEFFTRGLIQAYFPANIKATQPFLYSEKEKRIVSNDTYHMSMMMASVMDEMNKVASKDSLFPKEYRDMLQKWNAWIYEAVNLKIYQVAAMKGNKRTTGCAQLEEIYQFLDTYLEKKDYLYADQLTEADLRLFHNLVRHEFYYRQFKVFQKPLSAFRFLTRYVEHLLESHPDLKKDLYFDEIKITHFRSPHNIKKYGYIEEIPSLRSLFPFENTQ